MRLTRDDMHGYQNYCVDFIINNPTAALLLDCGLGKTITTLTAVNELMYNRFEISKTLIIAPLRVAQTTWTGEAEKWEHLGNLKLSRVLGSVREREQALQTDADIYIINRENVEWLVNNYDFDFDMIIIDEQR